jgi:hypothetical protein
MCFSNSPNPVSQIEPNPDASFVLSQSTGNNMKRESALRRQKSESVEESKQVLDESKHLDELASNAQSSANYHDVDKYGNADYPRNEQST